LTPEENHAGLVAFRIPNVDMERCAKYLDGHGVLVRSIPDNGALRISCGFYNTANDIDRALALISGYSAGDSAKHVN
jgi:selenocysteine lyase/cysteine desulfurase